MEDFSLTQTLPHRPPALLVQDVLETFEGGLVARVAWPEAEASPFLFIEAAAQCAAAYQGYRARLQGSAVMEGFLVAMRDFAFPETIPAGGTWTVRVAEIKNLNPFFLVDAVVAHDGRPLATGTLTCYQREKV